MGKFKELRVWQDAVPLAEKIYTITNTQAFFKDYGCYKEFDQSPQR